MTIPVIDERVTYAGPTALRGFNAKTLRELKGVLVIQVDEKPAAVVVPYDLYMKMQEAVWPSSLLPTLEKFLSGVGDGEVLSDNDGAEANSDMEHPADSHREPSGVEFTAAEFADNFLGARVDDSKPPVVDDIDERPQVEFPAKAEHDTYRVGPVDHDAGERAALHRPPLDTVVDAQREYVRGEIENCERLQGSTLEARGEGLTEDLIQKTIDDLPHKKEASAATLADDGGGPRCHHCGKLNAAILCPECFLAGHRNGNCLRCAEGGK
jgi:hypothetical protein